MNKLFFLSNYVKLSFFGKKQCLHRERYKTVFNNNSLKKKNEMSKYGIMLGLTTTETAYYKSRKTWK